MNKDHIVSYLAQGFKAEKIATILGCAPSYISEVQTEPWFAEALEEAKKKIKKTEAEVELEDKYTRLESALLTSVKEQMPFAEFRDLVKMTEVLIRRRQTSVPVGGIVFNNTQNNTVVLSVPAAVIPEIVLNQQREILAVGEQTMAPMTTHGVRDLFKKLEEKRKEPELVKKLIEDGQILETVPEDF